MSKRLDPPPPGYIPVISLVNVYIYRVSYQIPFYRLGEGRACCINYNIMHHLQCYNWMGSPLVKRCLLYIESSLTRTLSFDLPSMSVGRFYSGRGSRTSFSVLLLWSHSSAHCEPPCVFLKGLSLRVLWLLILKSCSTCL